jgi:hypothetical protein
MKEKRCELGDSIFAPLHNGAGRTSERAYSLWASATELGSHIFFSTVMGCRSPHHLAFRSLHNLCCAGGGVYMDAGGEFIGA